VWLRLPEVAVTVRVKVPLGVPGLRGALEPPPPHPPTQARVSKTRARAGAKARPSRGSFAASLKRPRIASNASAKSTGAGLRSPDGAADRSSKAAAGTNQRAADAHEQATGAAPGATGGDQRPGLASEPHAGLASDHATELGCANNEDAQAYTACQNNPHDPCSTGRQIDLRRGFMMANIGPRARLAKLEVAVKMTAAKENRD
jgi:hypothetical protein